MLAIPSPTVPDHLRLSPIIPDLDPSGARWGFLGANSAPQVGPGASSELLLPPLGASEPPLMIIIGPGGSQEAPLMRANVYIPYE